MIFWLIISYGLIFCYGCLIVFGIKVAQRTRNVTKSMLQLIRRFNQDDELADHEIFENAIANVQEEVQNI